MNPRNANTHRAGRSGLRGTVVLSFLIILFNTQIFTGTASNPFGIKGAQEGFFLLLFIWAVAALWIQQMETGSVRRLDLFVVLLVMGLTGYGALAANLTYGQPLLFGILEERRIFALLIYFPVATMLRRGWVSIVRFEAFIIRAAVICALIAAGIMLGLLPALQETRSSENTLRGLRLMVGPSYVAMGIPFLLARRKSEAGRFTVPMLILLLAVLVVVMQTRQLMLASAVASAFALRGPRVALVIFVTGISAYIALLLSPALSEKLSVLAQLFGQLASEEYFTESWRGLSYGYVIQSVTNGEIWGHGALSPLWREGFSRIIGPFFFLADIGIAGSFFRYGLPGLLINAVYLLVQFRILRAIRDRKRKALYGGIFLFILVALPVAAPLEYRGYIVGLLLAVSSFLAGNQTRSPQQ